MAAIERGFQKEEIERSAYDQLRAVEQGDRVVVGVNRYAGGEEEPVTIMQLDPAIADAQAKSLVDIRATRDQDAVQAASPTSATPPGPRQPPPPCATPSATATVGEVCDALRAEFGTYRPPTPSDRAPPTARRADGVLDLASSSFCGGCPTQRAG